MLAIYTGETIRWGTAGGFVVRDGNIVIVELESNGKVALYIILYIYRQEILNDVI